MCWLRERFSLERPPGTSFLYPFFFLSCRAGRERKKNTYRLHIYKPSPFAVFMVISYALFPILRERREVSVDNTIETLLYICVYTASSVYVTER